MYARVTSQIVSAIEHGVSNWRMPWHTSGKFAFSPINVTSKKPYRGIKTVCLWAAAQAKGYERGGWGTYQQWHERGAQVRKGEKATLVVFWKFANSAAETNDADTSGSRLLFTRGYSVFNAAQVDGYTAPKPDPDTPIEQRIERAEQSKWPSLWLCCLALHSWRLGAANESSHLCQSQHIRSELRNALRELREYAHRRGWEVAGEYVDSAWSGAKASRPQLNRLILDAGRPGFDAVLGYKLDRFGRSVRNCLDGIEALRAHGVRFLAVSQNIDIDENNPTSRLMLHILEAVAEFEREMI